MACYWKAASLKAGRHCNIVVALRSFNCAILEACIVASEKMATLCYSCRQYQNDGATSSPSPAHTQQLDIYQ